MDPVEPVDRIAPRAGHALVAARGVVVEIAAARALEQVTADGRDVADLRARPRQDRARQHRIVRTDRAVGRERGVGHPRADHHATIGADRDLARQAGHVDQRRRPLDRLAHQIDQVGPAAEIFRVWRSTRKRDRAGNVIGARIAERRHATSSGRAGAEA